MALSRPLNFLGEEEFISLPALLISSASKAAWMIPDWATPPLSGSNKGSVRLAGCLIFKIEKTSTDILWSLMSSLDLFPSSKCFLPSNTI